MLGITESGLLKTLTFAVIIGVFAFFIWRSNSKEAYFTRRTKSWERACARHNIDMDIYQPARDSAPCEIRVKITIDGSSASFGRTRSTKLLDALDYDKLSRYDLKALVLDRMEREKCYG